MSKPGAGAILCLPLKRDADLGPARGAHVARNYIIVITPMRAQAIRHRGDVVAMLELRRG